jgi:hypothetical protein
VRIVKKAVKFTIIGLGLIIMLACEKNDEPLIEEERNNIPEVFNNDLEGRIPEPTEHLLDNFNNGLDPNIWSISTRNWTPAVSNGQKANNVNYTEDGLLVLEAKGALYPSDTDRLTGAAIISKEKFGPGAYEVAMKVLPRLGAVSAVWTFYYENEDFNHEIDIELPANKSYESVMNTTWVGTKGQDYTSNIVPTLTPANDGQWHKYRFEWSTDQKEIKYYVDDVLTSIIKTHVPDHHGHIWLGVWFPNNWAGEPDFEKDYMLVDWISYEPYDTEDHPSHIGEATDRMIAPIDLYPNEPISLERRNYIANGDFEDQTSAWKYETNDAFITSMDAFKNENALIISNNSSASQLITAQYHNYSFNISLYAKVIRGEGSVIIEYLDDLGEVIPNSSETLIINKDFYQGYMKEFTTVSGTKSIRVILNVDGDSIILFDDVRMILI